MKKLIAPLILLAGIVGFCTLCTWYTEKVCRDTADFLYQAETRCALGDFEGAGELVLASQRQWERHEGFLGMALRHTESDDIDIMYPPLLETCRQRNTEDFNQKNLELRAALRLLSRMEIPFYFNVL